MLICIIKHELPWASTLTSRAASSSHIFNANFNALNAKKKKKKGKGKNTIIQLSFALDNDMNQD